MSEPCRRSHDCAQTEDALTALRAEVERLRPLIKLSIPVLEMADAWFRAAFDETCDHDEDCFCDRRAMALVGLADFRAAWRAAAGEGE